MSAVALKRLLRIMQAGTRTHGFQKSGCTLSRTVVPSLDYGCRGFWPLPARLMQKICETIHQL